MKTKDKRGICKKCGHSIVIYPNGSWFHLHYRKHPSKYVLQDRGLKKGDCDCNIKEDKRK